MSALPRNWRVALIPVQHAKISPFPRFACGAASSLLKCFFFVCLFHLKLEVYAMCKFDALWPLKQLHQDIYVKSSVSDEEINIQSEAALLMPVDFCELQDQEHDCTRHAPCMSTCAADPDALLNLDSTPQREIRSRGHRGCSPASPSESLHTVVTYNASFATPHERMEFALKACHLQYFVHINFSNVTML